MESQTQTYSFVYIKLHLERETHTQREIHKYFLYTVVLLGGFVWHLSLKRSLKIFEKDGIPELCLNSWGKLLKDDFK